MKILGKSVLTVEYRPFAWIIESKINKEFCADLSKLYIEFCDF